MDLLPPVCKKYIAISRNGARDCLEERGGHQRIELGASVLNRSPNPKTLSSKPRTGAVNQDVSVLKAVVGPLSIITRGLLKPGQHLQLQRKSGSKNTRALDNLLTHEQG